MKAREPVSEQKEKLKIKAEGLDYVSAGDPEDYLCR